MPSWESPLRSAPTSARLTAPGGQRAARRTPAAPSPDRLRGLHPGVARARATIARSAAQTRAPSRRFSIEPTASPVSRIRSANTMAGVRGDAARYAASLRRLGPSPATPAGLALRGLQTVAHSCRLGHPAKDLLEQTLDASLHLGPHSRVALPRQSKRRARAGAEHADAALRVAADRQMRRPGRGSTTPAPAARKRRSRASEQIGWERSATMRGHELPFLRPSLLACSRRTANAS